MRRCLPARRQTCLGSRAPGMIHHCKKAGVGGEACYETQPADLVSKLRLPPCSGTTGSAESQMYGNLRTQTSGPLSVRRFHVHPQPLVFFRPERPLQHRVFSGLMSRLWRDSGVGSVLCASCTQEAVERRPEHRQ